MCHCHLLFNNLHRISINLIKAITLVIKYDGLIEAMMI